MMCSNCGKREANFMYTEIINGVKKEVRLCSDCAEKLGYFENMSFNMPSLDFNAINFFRKRKSNNLFKMWNGI